MYEVSNFSNKSQVVFGKGGYQLAEGLGGQPSGIFIENILEELDQVDEWFWDEDKSLLYVGIDSPINETDDIRMTIAVGQAETLIEAQQAQPQP